MKTVFRAEIALKIPKVTILHHMHGDGSLWGTRGRWLLRGRSGGEWEKLQRFPLAFPRDLFGFSRPSARAMRADKANVYVNKLGNILGIRSSTVYRMSLEGGPTPLFEIQGDSVLHGGITEDDEGNVYLGEYFMNPSRNPVRVWGLPPDLSTGEVVHTFPKGSLRHIHGVYRDPFDPEAMWITSGDYENECFLYRTRDRFRSVERYGDGSQIWRAVRLFFTPDHVSWLTDSQIEQNYACRMDRSNGFLEVGQPIAAPTWYGSMTKDGFYVAFTTVEPGPAVRREDSAILVSEDGFSWQEVVQFPKDRWRPMKIFKYGVISCPSGVMSSEAFYLSGEGLQGLDGVSARLRIYAEG